MSSASVCALCGSPAGGWRRGLPRTVLSGFPVRFAIPGTSPFLGDLGALRWTYERSLRDRLARARLVGV
jgi:hypothetical protein